MKKFTTFLFIFILISAAARTQNRESDSLALAQLYFSTNGSEWTNDDNWFFTSIDLWYGVTVENGRVVELDLENNNIVGAIPTELGSLSELIYLNLTSNKFTGELPEEIGNLLKLEYLWLGDNLLSGSLPTSINDLASLKSIIFDGNNFSGSLPDFQGAPSLTLISMKNNNFSGSTIPKDWGALADLEVIDLTGCGLAGVLPSELSGCEFLDELRLSGNFLMGKLPSSLGDLDFLRVLELSGNRFSDEIPPEIGGMVSLQTFDLSDNDFSGVLPSELANLTSLKNLYLNGNSFEGAFPDAMKNITSYEKIYLQNNNFESIPDFSAAQDNLIELKAESNKLQFISLEPNYEASVVGGFEFTYDPQATIGENKSIYAVSGEPVKIESGALGEYNAYKWIKDGAEVSGAKNKDYDITSMSAAAEGDYMCEISNSLITDMTMQTAVTKLIMRTNEANIQPDNESVDFGSIEVGGSSSEERITIINIGAQTANIIGARIEPSSLESVFEIQNKLDFVSRELKTDSIINLRIVFKPQESGLFTAKVIVESETNSAEIDLSGRGRGDDEDLVQIETLNFGRVPIGDSKSLKMALRNISENIVTYTLNENITAVLGEDCFAYDPSNDIQPGEEFDLAPGQTDSVLVKFSPKAYGPKEGSSNITARVGGGEDVSASGKLIGIAGVMKIDDKDVGTVARNSNFRAALPIRNVHGEIIKIKSLTVDDPDGVFSLKEGEFFEDLTIGAQDSVVLVVLCRPTKIGPISADITVVAQVGDFLDTAKAVYSGECKVRLINSARTTVGLRTIPESAKPGETVKIQVVLLDKEGLSVSLGSRFRAAFRFNKNILDPKIPADNSTLVSPLPALYNPYRSVRALQPLDRQIGNDVLLEIEAVAMLTSSDKSSLVMEDFGWLDNSFTEIGEVNILDGEFNLDVCSADGKRLLFKKDYSASIISVSPNPASDAAYIKYSLLEDAPAEMYIANMFGEKVATAFDKNAQSGVYGETIDLAELPSGYYMIIMKTPNQTDSMIMRVVK